MIINFSIHLLHLIIMIGVNFYLDPHLVIHVSSVIKIMGESIIGIDKYY